MQKCIINSLCYEFLRFSKIFKKQNTKVNRFLKVYISDLLTNSYISIFCIQRCGITKNNIKEMLTCDWKFVLMHEPLLAMPLKQN